MTKEKKKKPDYFCEPVANFEHTEVCRMDRPGVGGAAHHYEIFTQPDGDEMGISLCNINFQEGRVADVGVNGIQHEDIMMIMIDRLRSFQKGPYACDGNVRALVMLEAPREHMEGNSETTA